jgi:hypothetical protein
MTLRVSFLRRNGQIGGVLLSPEKDMDYRVDCEYCSPPGFETIVPNPLCDATPTEKILMVSSNEGTRKQGGRVRLLTRFQAKPGQQWDVDSYPRAELVIIIPPER